MQKEIVLKSSAKALQKIKAIRLLMILLGTFGILSGHSAPEQTAASMEVLAYTFKQNFESGKLANQLAETDSQVALQGKNAVAEVVHTTK